VATPSDSQSHAVHTHTHAHTQSSILTDIKKLNINIPNKLYVTDSAGPGIVIHYRITTMQV